MSEKVAREMKLWILAPIKGLKDDPWDPWYDKAFGFIVRAATEEEARKLVTASEMVGGEKEGAMMKRKDSNIWPRKFVEGTQDPWMKPELSTCVELTADGPEAVILVDFASA